MSLSTIINTAPALALAFLGFGFLVGFHELGHFLFCKLFGVRTPSFSIGFGPRIFQKKIGDTVFTLSAIPGGGYVEIAGADEPGQGSQLERASMAPDSFAIKPYYQKMLIIAGGILFNLIFAYTAVILTLALGAPETPLLSPLNFSGHIEKITEDMPAQAADLQVGDTITALTDGTHTHIGTDVLGALRANVGKSITLTVHRDQQELQVPVTLDAKGLGVEFALNPVKAETILQAVTLGVQQVNFWIYSIGNAVYSLFTQGTLKGVGGPVSVMSAMVKGAQAGFTVFILFLAFISVNLAVMNVIPLPVFDGGQALTYTIEALMGRPLPETVRNYIAYGTWILLIVFMVWITGQDILRMLA